MKTLKYNIDVVQKDDEIFKLMQQEESNEVHSNAFGFYVEGSFIRDFGASMPGVVFDKYIAKDVCAVFEDNISQPSVRVPTRDTWKYIVKEDLQLSFVDKNPLKDFHIDSFEFLSLASQTFSSTLLQPYKDNLQIASRLERHISLTGDQVLQVYSFPFGGISKANSYFFYVDLQNKIHILDRGEVLLDYIEGFLYLDNLLDVKQVFGLFNLETVKITPFGSLNTKGVEEGFYKIGNTLPLKQNILIEYLNNSSLVINTKEDIFILLPENRSYTLKIDGIPTKPNQYLFIKRDSLTYMELVEKQEEQSLEHKGIDLSSFFIEDIKDSFNKTIGTSVTTNTAKYSAGLSITVFKKTSEGYFNKSTPVAIELALKL